jgi:hypothetical protein
MKRISNGKVAAGGRSFNDPAPTNFGWSALLRAFFIFPICTSFSNPALAQMSIFQTAMFAQMHCPNDKVVWLDFTKRRYYSEGQRLYGKGRTGSFVCKEEARKSGYRRSLLGRR